jgi:Glycosyltransferase family 87
MRPGITSVAIMSEPDSAASTSRGRVIRLSLFAAAVVGLLAGIDIFVLHVTSDPLTDVRAYYDAGARLNAGLPLYPAGADPDAPEFYRYPPLLAIAFRPLALLPYPAAAAAWEAVVLGAFAWSVRRVGGDRATWLALGILAMPIAWMLSVGQAQALVTALTVIGAPWAIALAGQIKLFPLLVGVYWLGLRDWRSVGALASWTLVLALGQLILEPSGTLAYLTFPNLGQVGDVNNLSPYAISPILWAVLAIAGVVAAIRLAPGHWGWAAAVFLSVLATPRLLSYQLSTLLAALKRPESGA